jgi:hypothetical protein
MSPWRWTQIKGLKHVGQWNCTINVTELYILSDCEYKVKMYGMNNIELTNTKPTVNNQLKFWIGFCILQLKEDEFSHCDLTTENKKNNTHFSTTDHF